MKKRTAVFGWTKKLQRAEQTIKASTRHLNILNPSHADHIKAASDLMASLNLLHKRRVFALRGVQ